MHRASARQGPLCSRATTTRRRSCNHRINSWVWHNPPAGLPSVSSDRRRVDGLLILLFGITYLDRVCISVAGPRMQADLHINPVGWGWVTGAFLGVDPTRSHFDQRRDVI